ncbi:hypothetical protein [Streptomyces sp. NTH33]|uniref:hypothetical protein n=1 Tax=Streptomyces sp. NTH33 TaxID=1735453 RepID=UPI0026C186A1
MTELRQAAERGIRADLARVTVHATDLAAYRAHAPNSAAAGAGRPQAAEDRLGPLFRYG